MWVFNKLNRISKKLNVPLIAFAVIFSLPVEAMDGIEAFDRKVELSQGSANVAQTGLTGEQPLHIDVSGVVHHLFLTCAN